MSQAQTDYWIESVSIAFEESGIQASQEQIQQVAADVEGCHDNYGLAFHTPSGPSPQEQEITKLRKDLEKERNKRMCDECNGRGRIITQGPYHSSDSECWNCRGDGRV